jgi:Flp pilus assembly protein CpaB
MSRRGRAIAFASAAAVCAGLAAAATGRPDPDLAGQGGELQDVLVAARPLAARQRLAAARLHDAVEVRRIPERFVPGDALASPAEVAGRRPAVAIPAGGYVLSSELVAPRARASARPEADPGHRPVEITVTAAGTLASGQAASRRVDVVVTSEPGPGGGAGRTYVAAPAVELLDLRPAAEAGGDVVPGPAGGDNWIATLALTRDQALRLIQAESFARAVRLIAR